MKKIGIIFATVVLIMLAVFFLICPPANGEMRLFTDERGEIMKNSISVKTKIDIEGYDVNLYIMGQDVNNPVLLVCGGGPGIPQYLLECMYPSVLPEKFVVCYFDYVACGASYIKTDPERITNELLFKEASIITDYLKERFNKEKIYIMGHSFGSFIALNVINMHPENYVAYLAVSQATNQTESELMAYDYMKEEYAKMGNSKMVAELEKYKVRESEDDFKKYKHAGTRDNAMHGLGVGTTRDMNSVITGILLPSLRCKEYTIPERFNIWRGKIQSNDFVAGIGKFDSFEEIKKLEFLYISLVVSMIIPAV